jgi:hypothetical protein
MIKLNIRVSLVLLWKRALSAYNTASCAALPIGRLGFATFSPSLRYGENVAYAGNVV